MTSRAKCCEVFHVDIEASSVNSPPMVYLNDYIMWNISTCLLNENSTQNFKRSIGSRSHPQNARETGGRSYRFPFCTKIRGVLAVQIGASLPSAPWGVWCQQNVFCSQKFTSLSPCLMFNLLWIETSTCCSSCLMLATKTQNKSNKQLPWCSFRNADFSTFYTYTSWSFNTKPRIKQNLGIFLPAHTCVGKFHQWRKLARWGLFMCFHTFLVSENGTIYRISLSTQASFNLMFVWCLSPGVLDQWKLVAQGCPKLTWQLIVHQWCLH